MTISALVAEEFNTSESVINKNSRQKITRDKGAPPNTINQNEVLSTCKTLCTKDKTNIFSRIVVY